MASRQVVWLALSLAAVIAACTRVETGSPSSVPLGEGGSAGAGAGQTGSLAGEGGDGMGGMSANMAGAPVGLELSLWPTFAIDPEQPQDAQAVFAGVSVLSAGTRTLTLAERWSDLSGPTGSPRTVTWSRLDAMVKPFRDRAGNVAFCIDVVDRRQAAWPFTGSLSLASSRQAMHRTIDDIYARYAAQLSHLCFGYEVDRYVAASSKADGERLLDFLQDSVSYARTHPARTARVAVGVAVTLGALSDTEGAARWSFGDEAIAVYDPLSDQGELKPIGWLSDELDVALESLGESQPLALWEVGYPSGGGSSQKAQRDFYEALLGVLAARAQRLSFVSLFGLSDRATSECDAEALLFDDDAERAQARSRVRCTMGLRAESEPKLAWPAALSALSTYR